MSGRKNVLEPYHLIVAQSMTTSVTSNPTNIQFLDDVGIQLNFSGAPVGTFNVQGSLDYNQVPGVGGRVITAGNWINMTLSPAPVATGTSGNILLDLYGLSFPWIRVVYNAVSGTGTLDAYITGKSI